MPLGDQLFIAMVVAALALFAGVLAYASFAEGRDGKRRRQPAE